MRPEYERGVEYPGLFGTAQHLCCLSGLDGLEKPAGLMPMGPERLGADAVGSGVQV